VHVWPGLGLRDIIHAYPRALPNQVRSLCAFHFLLHPSDPIVSGNTLAIRIVFPLVRVTSAFSSRPSELAMLNKQKGLKRKPHFSPCAFLWVRTPWHSRFLLLQHSI